MHDPQRGLSIGILHKERRPANECETERVFAIVRMNAHEKEEQFLAETDTILRPEPNFPFIGGKLGRFSPVLRPIE